MSLKGSGDERVDLPRAVVDLLLQAEEGSGGCLIVERGAQETALLDDVAGEAMRRGIDARIAVASPVRYEVLGTVRSLFGLDPDTEEADELEQHGTDLPALRRLVASVDELCVEAPVLLAVDLAEHVDAASARFLAYLARNLDARSVSVLLVAADVSEGSWLAELSDALGSPPLHVQSVVAPRLGGIDVLDHLAEGERGVVEALAVLGPDPSIAALAVVAEQQPSVVLRTLDLLLERDLLRRAGGAATGHLVAEALVLQGLTPTRRSELHVRAAAHLRSIGEPAVRVAAHLEHAVPGSHPWAGDVLRTGAARVLETGDAVRAVTWLQRAVEESTFSDGEVPMPVLLELVRAQLRAGSPGATASLRLAIERATGEQRQGLQVRLARHLGLTGRLDEAVDLLEGLLAELDMQDPAQSERVLEIRTALTATCRLSLHLRDRSAELLDQLRSSASGQVPEDPGVLAELAYEHALAGTDREVVIDLGYRALGTFARHRLPALGAQVLFLSLLWAEDFEGARVVCDRLRHDERADPVFAHRRGAIALAEGDLDLATAHLRAAVTDMEWVSPLLVPSSRALLARALVRRDDLDGAAAALRLPGGDDRWRLHSTYHPVLLAQAELAAASGDWRRAVAFAEACAEFSAQMGTRNPAVVPWPIVAARALARCGRVAEAEATAGEALDRAERFGAPRILAALRELWHEVRESTPGHEPRRAALPVSASSERGAPQEPYVQLLGDTVLVTDGEQRRLGDDLVDRTVCIVALAETGIHDEQLAESLWPDGDPRVGRTRLRNVLLRVRQRHGPIIERSGRTIQLAEHISVDVRAFERLATEALSATDDAAAERIGSEALALHHGELCPTHPFEMWAAAPRAATRQRWLALLDRLADLAARRGDVATAMALFEQAVAAEPWDEDRYLDAVERLIAADRTSAARALLKRSASMCEELGVPPSRRHAALQEALG